MLRDSVINFLEATIVLLTLTNLVSICVAAYAMALAYGVGRAVLCAGRASCQALDVPR
jgi:hypothetical protein